MNNYDEKKQQTYSAGKQTESEKRADMNRAARKKGFEQFADFLQEFEDDGNEEVRFGDDNC